MLGQGAEAAGEEGLLCERWQMEAGLARVAAATNDPAQAEVHTRRARELIDTMVASAGEPCPSLSSLRQTPIDL
jgi:hypothetical protein